MTHSNPTSQTTDPRLCTVCGLSIHGPGALHCSAIHDDAAPPLNVRLKASTCFIEAQVYRDLMAYASRPSEGRYDD